MPHSLKDPLLIKTKDNIESKLPAQLQQTVNKIVIAGGKILYGDQTHGSIIQPIYDAVAKGGFQPEAIATGIVNLLATIYKATQGRMPLEGAFPAGVILLCYVLDDLEQTKGLKVTPELLKAISTPMMEKFKQAFKGGPETAQPGAPNPANSQPGGLAQTAASPPPTIAGAM